MNEEWLRSFVAFADHLSFTAAARALHISQPALHVQVKKLSEALGVTLYRREGRTLVLSKEGERVCAFGREQAERTNQFMGSLRGRPVRDPVVLSAGAGAFQYLLSQAIRSYVRKGVAPLRVLTQDRDASLRAVQRGEAHLGVAALDHVPEQVHAERLTSVGAVLVMKRAHRLAKKRSVSLHDLRGERLIVPPDGRPHRVMINRALMSAGVHWEPAIEASGWDLLMHFAQLELGIAIVNAFCTPPRECVARALPAIPEVAYYLFRNRARALDGGVYDLHETILRSVRTEA